MIIRFTFLCVVFTATLPCLIEVMDQKNVLICPEDNRDILFLPYHIEDILFLS